MIPASYLPYLLLMYLGKPADGYSSEHVSAMKSGINRVYGTKASSAEIEQVKRFFGNERFLWFVENIDHELGQQLEKAGLKCHLRPGSKIAATLPAMNILLNKITPQEYAHGIRIEKINASSLKLWLSLVIKSYDPPSEDRFTHFIDSLIQRAGPDHTHFYIGYYHGTPAATSVLLDHPQVVSLHWVSTLSEYRNKGLGYAVSHKPLVDAKERGFSQAILFASEMGKPVYEKIGFKEYAEYEVYG